jgi:hypothetical protein
MGCLCQIVTTVQLDISIFSLLNSRKQGIIHLLPIYGDVNLAFFLSVSEPEIDPINMEK